VAKVPLEISAAGLADIEACVGEPVAVTSGHFNIVAKTDFTHPYVFHRNVVHGRVTGLSTGTVYPVQGHLQDVYLPNSGSETFALALKAVSPGSDPDFMAHFLFHITITPAGDVTAFTSDFTITCS
jgi:hypothetical protein